MSNNASDFKPYIPAEKITPEFTIFIENKGPFNWLAQKLFFKPRFSQVHLEEFGNFIWPLIDGKKQ